MMLGKSLGKRFIEPYKFWKQDDRERVRRRKLMIQKQFKGRRRPKVDQLSASREAELIKLIEDQANHEDEEEECEDWLETSLKRCWRGGCPTTPPRPPVQLWSRLLSTPQQ